MLASRRLVRTARKQVVFLGEGDGVEPVIGGIFAPLLGLCHSCVRYDCFSHGVYM